VSIKHYSHHKNISKGYIAWTRVHVTQTKIVQTCTNVYVIKEFYLCLTMLTFTYNQSQY